VVLSEKPSVLHSSDEGYGGFKRRWSSSLAMLYLKIEGVLKSRKKENSGRTLHTAFENSHLWWTNSVSRSSKEEVGG
jgi:hypothetical protein